MKKGKSTTSLLKNGGKVQMPEARHCKTKSMTSLAHDTMVPVSASGSTQTILASTNSHATPGMEAAGRFKHAKSSSLLTVTPGMEAAGKFRSSEQSLAMLAQSDMAPPLPMRSSKCRPPARPPYPSSLVRAVQEITQPLPM